MFYLLFFLVIQNRVKLIFKGTAGAFFYRNLSRTTDTLKLLS